MVTQQRVKGRNLATLLLIGAGLLASAQAQATCAPMPDGKPRFVIKGAEVADRKTGLIWQRCSLGLVFDAAKGCTGNPIFFSLDDAQVVAGEQGKGWHVPSGPELQSLIDIDCGSPAIDTSVFSDITPDEDGKAYYWTTNAVGMIGMYYYFDLMTGRADGLSPSFHLSVRLVRAAR